MPYELKGRNVLVTGGSRGLGAVICEKFAAAGCNVAVNYVSNAKAAADVSESIKSKYGVMTCIVQGDAGVAADNVRVVNETVEKLGGVDVVVANAGWTRFAKPGDIYDLKDEEWHKCWTTNVMSHLQLMQKLAPIFNANKDGGVYLITSSIAGLATAGSSIGYSVTKAAGLHLMKHLAYTQAPKIRVNAVLPGLLLTEWGQQYSPQAISAIKEKSALRHETYLDDCADMFITLARNDSMTGQQITVDSGVLLGHI